MAPKTKTIDEKAVPATQVPKRYRALGNILGDPVGSEADLATRSIAPNVLYRKGSIVRLSKKDAVRLLKIKAVEIVK